MILVPLICGVGIGAGCWLGARALMPRPPDLQTALSELRRPAALSIGSASSHRDRLGRRMLRFGRAVGLFAVVPQSDLEVSGWSADRLAFDKVLTCVYLALLPLGVAAALGAAGVDAPTALLLASAPIVGAVGFLVPDLTLRSRAQQRRREFRVALGAYLDLVTVILAGGGGTESALADAASAGGNWAFQRLRSALASCRLSGTTPWTAFDCLGAETGIDELRELAASVGLAGEQGARVRMSLVAKTASIREHETAVVEAEAQAATERMALPLVMLLFSFVVFIGYPAVIRVLTGI